MSKKVSDEEYREIVAEAESCGMDAREFFIQECLRAWGRAHKTHVASEKVQAEAERIIDRERTHDAAVRFLEKCRQPAATLGKGYQRDRGGRDHWGNIRKSKEGIGSPKSHGGATVKSKG